MLRLDQHFPYLNLPPCAATVNCAPYPYPKTLGGGYVAGVRTPARYNYERPPSEG